MKTISENCSLFTALSFTGARDVGDSEWDVLVNVEAYEEDDIFGMCMNALNSRIRYISHDDDYMTADISSFMVENRQMMSEFMAEFNGEDYQFDDDDEGVYHAVLTWESLIIGNYSDRAYQWLYDRL